MSLPGALVGIKLKGHDAWLCVSGGAEAEGGVCPWSFRSPAARAPTWFRSAERAVAYAQEFGIKAGTYDVLPVP